MLGCSSAGVGLGATGSLITGELLDEAVLVPVEGTTHCEDASPAGGPNVEELPDPSCSSAAAVARLIAAALTFLPALPKTIPNCLQTICRLFCDESRGTAQVARRLSYDKIDRS